MIFTGLKVTVFKKADINPSDRYIKFRFNAEKSPECIMTLRPAGGMGRNSGNDSENRKNILKNLGINRYFSLKQIHSRIVYNSDDLYEGVIKEGDGLFSFRKENILAVTIADCMPVFFFNRLSGVFGVLHSGWKGTGITAEALSSIDKYSNSSPEDFEFILGPSIGPCCYEVDRERASVFKNLYGSDTVIFNEKNKGHYIDLRKANIKILEKKGIKNITVMENCTCCSKNFYSFRGDGAEQFQLMLALIGYFI